MNDVEALPGGVQARLLTVLQGSPLERPDAEPEPAMDIRVIAAANRPLEQLREENLLRNDLFFFLTTVTLHVPPLRERLKDIAAMAHVFLEEFNKKYRRNVSFSSAAYFQMREYGWPGNVRELRSYVERAVLFNDGSLPIQAEGFQPSEPPPREDGFEVTDEPLEVQLRARERQIIETVLERCGGNRTRAMEVLGIGRRTFYRKCANLGVVTKMK